MISTGFDRKAQEMSVEKFVDNVEYLPANAIGNFQKTEKIKLFWMIGIHNF